MDIKKPNFVLTEKGGLALALCLLFFSTAGIYVSRVQLQSIAASKVSVEQPPLYLPREKYVRLVTLGYDTFASKLLWFKTINYFGKQFAGSQDYRWLGEMCELVTVLDPKAKHTFEFCGTLLSWVAREPELSSRILSIGIKANPDYWRLLYLRGFNYWFFQNQLELAKEDFLAASHTPDAPAFLQTIAAQMVAKQNGPSLARKFLEEFTANTKDPAAKKALEKKLVLARLSERLDILQRAVERYQSEKGTVPTELQQLVAEGYLREIPPEPFGKEFVIADGKVKSTSNKEGIRFVGKTAETSPAFAAERKKKQ